MYDFSVLDGVCFTNPSEVDAFCKWYLRNTVADVEDEFATEGSKKKFLQRQELRLKAELDSLSELDFSSAAKCSYKDKKTNFFRIVKEAYSSEPLSGEGSLFSNSRFNYKNVAEMRNRVLYLSQSKECCYAELFHLDIQKNNYAQLIGRKKEEIESEFKMPKYWFFEFEVDLDNILVLTADPTFKALKIPRSVVMNEWFDLNQQFEIPSASQILGVVARKKGYKGILYASARTQTKNNLIIFEENTGRLNFNITNKYELDHSHFE